MKKVAVFGKPGNGKSTLSKKLSAKTGIPLYPLDSIVYKPNGETIDRSVFADKHAALLAKGSWIIDGLGPLSAFYERLNQADTLIYIDLPYSTSYWLATKRCLKGLFVKPEGWPEGSSILKGTWNSYKMLRLSPRFWNKAFMEKLQTLSEGKRLHVVKSVAELNSLIDKGLYKEGRAK